MGYGLISLCYLWLGSTNTVLSYSNASLSRSKQRALAALVHLTLEPQQHGELFMDDCDNADDCDEEERDCLTALVRLVDYAFTSVASPVAIAALQSVDDGVNASEARQLLGEIDRQLGGLQLRKECAPEKNVERRNWRGYSAQTQKACLERIAVALVRATRQGKSANFKLEESAADQILRLLSSPLRRMAEFANPFLSLDPVSDLFSDTDFSNLGFLLLVLLAGAGLLVIAEAYVLSPLLGNKEEAAAGSGNGGNGGIGNAIGNAIEGFDARSFENDVPCYCRLCEGGIVRGRRIGEGGFGKCFLCNVLEKKKKSAAITTSPRATAAAAIGTTSAAKGAAGAGGSTTAVVKMIRTNFFYDVNVLQDALDEAKNLLSLRHQHIVKYLDVFVHRDNRAMRASRRKKSRSLSFGASGAFSDDDFGSDSDGDAAKKAALEEDKQEEEDERKGFDFVCIVMEYCAGGTLLEYVATGVPLPIDVLLCSFFQIATALRYVHRSGIVHHDVKLENIFIARCPTSMPSLSSSNISSAATFRPSSPVSPPKSANHRNRRRSRKGGGPGVSAALSSAAVTPPLPPSPASAVQQRDHHHHHHQQEPPSPQQPKESFVIKLGDFGLAVRQPSSVAPAATLVMSTALPASPIHSPPRNRQRQRQNTAQEAAVALNFDKPRDENRYKSEEPTVVQGPIDASSLEGKPRSDADGDDEGIAGAREHSDRAWSAPRAMATDDSTATTDRGAPTRELNMPGTKPYQAPECFDSERRPEDLTAAVDVWGFGCSLYEAVTCQSLPLESPFLGEIANQGFLRQQRRQRRRERRLFPPASPSAAAVDVNSGGSSRSGRDNYDDYDEDRGVDDYDEGHDDEDFDEDDWASAWADLSLNFAEGVQSLALCALADKNIDIGSLHGTGGGSAHQPSPATSPAPGSSAAFTSAAKNSKQRKKGKRGGRRRRRGENDYDAAADDDRAMAWNASSSSPSSSEQKQADGSRAAVRSAVEAARNGLCELLRRCLSPDPHDRPSFDHIVNLPWLIPFRRSTLRFGFSFGRPAGSSNDQHRHRNNLRLRAKSMALFPGIPMRDSKNNSLVSAITQQRSLGRAVVRGAPVPQQRRRNSQDSSGSSGDDDDDDDDDDGNPPTQEWLLPPASRRAAQRRQQRNTKAKSTGP